MSVADGAAALAKGAKNLQLRWELTKEGWQDQTRWRFGEEHLEPLEADIKVALAALTRLNELFERIRRECG